MAMAGNLAIGGTGMVRGRCYRAATTVGEPNWDESGRRSSLEQAVPQWCSSSRGDRRLEAVLVIAGGDLGAIKVRSTRAMLLEVAMDREMAGGGLLSHPVFKTKTRCSSYVCPGSSCHTYGQNVSTEYQCLYYNVSY
jgi:hypothetical protein